MLADAEWRSGGASVHVLAQGTSALALGRRRARRSAVRPPSPPASRRTTHMTHPLSIARDRSQGRDVDGITFEHYEGMAQKKLREIRERALKDFDILELLIIHRYGDITIGETLADPADPRLQDYVGLTDVALRRRTEPERGLYIAESAKVIGRALAAGHRVRSMLVQEKWLDEIRALLAGANVSDAAADAGAGGAVVIGGSSSPADMDEGGRGDRVSRFRR